MTNTTEAYLRRILKVKNILAGEGDIFCYQDQNHTYWLDRRTEWPIGSDTAIVFPLAADNVRVFVICPFCKEIHVHGHGEGYRSSDCPISVRNAAYYLKDE